MMKQRTNFSVQTPLGIRTTPDLILGDYNGYKSGDILDANAVVSTILKVSDAAATVEKISVLENKLEHLLKDAPEELDELREIIAELLKKANAATTAEGYGIQDVYTKPEVDERIQYIESEYEDPNNYTVDTDIEHIFNKN